jgi:exodeoxyribonuclease VII large subunit
MDSDSKTNSTSDDLVKLSDIITNISNYVNSNRNFKSVNAEVEITELKEYPTLVFMRVCEPKQEVIKAVIYKANYKTKLNPGNKIRINCELKFYRHELEVIINSYALAGTGSQTKALSKLKGELAELGYFDNKKRIESNYHTIGIISSIKAAGFKDFIHTLNSRCSGKKVYLYPAKVQGATAPKELESAIKLANKHDLVQILVIIRGGGGKDDLECFNDRIVAKAIFKSKLPVVTGIGHQIDTSVADLVADQNFITPTAVAQSITEENILTAEKIGEKIILVKNLLQAKLDLWSDYLSNCEGKIQKYRHAYTDRLRQIYQSHQTKQKDLKQKIKIVAKWKYDYLVRVEMALSDLKEKTMGSYSNSLGLHLNHLELVNTSLKEKIFAMDDEIRILARPKIICTDTDEEVNTLKKFKTGHNYQICFLDGSYDIKIRSK